MYNCVASWQSLGLFHQFSPLVRQTNLHTSFLHEYPPLCRFFHDHVIKWKHFPRYWPFVRGSPRWIPHTKASDVELWWVFYLRPCRRLSKQSQGWWFETLSRPLWRQCNDPRIRQPLSFRLPRICTLCHTSQELKTIKFVMFSIMAIS